jgi:hypothetical protein
MGFIADMILKPQTDWTQDEAIALCITIEAICPAYGCHVALTGGCLYKDGPRKDLDILFYRIRQEPQIDIDGLFAALDAIGIIKESGFAWCVKATKDGRNIDCFFPEAEGDYSEKPAEDDVTF